MAIIEVIFHDFIVRLSEATNHFPSTIDDEKRKKIKRHISDEKVFFETGRLKRRMLRVKNYSLSQILKILQKFELLAPKDDPIYNTLEEAPKFRNRIHLYLNNNGS